MKKRGSYFRHIGIALVMVLFLFGFSVLPAQAQVVFSEDFEAGWGTWSADNGMWQVGTPTAGPASCYGGTQCAGTNLAGNYGEYTDRCLISANLQLSTVTGVDELHLRFINWFSYAGGDSGQVQVSVWNASTSTWGDWVNEGIPIIHASGWSLKDVDLTAYAGETVRIAFYHTASRPCCGNYKSTCWYIDDITIENTCDDTDSYYCDKDGDNHFNTSTDDSCTGVDCEQTLGCQLTPGDDCNDNDDTVYLGAAEICDNIDNDCDGPIDEDLTRETTCGVGACAGNTGTETCTAGAWGDDTCNLIEGATPEVCDNTDNDCDGPIDEDFTALGNECTNGMGVCERSGNMVCKADESGTECNAVPGKPTEDPEATCDDGLDNDCDGYTDSPEDSDCPLTCGAPHWIAPDISNIQMHLAGYFTIDAEEGRVCDEVAVFDSEDIIIGHFIVDTEGEYGDLVVSGDSLLTSDIDEGAADGEKLSIKVWDALNQKEHINSNIRLVTPDSGIDLYEPYQPPLRFVAGTWILMDIEVNLGCDIDLESGWNLFGWMCDYGYHEGTEPPMSEYATDSTLIPVNSLEDALNEIDPSENNNHIAVGPDGKVYVSGLPFNTLKNLLPGWAYWKHVNEDRTITLPGYVLDPSSSLPLTEGWKQIAYWGDDGLSPEDAFKCIDGKYDVILNGDGQIYAKGSPFNTLGGIYQSEGYFIHMTESATLKYDCQ